MRVRPPREERRQRGTRADRRSDIPIGVRIRYGIAILVALVAAWAAYRASTTASASKHETAELGQLVYRSKDLSRQNAILVRRVTADERASCTIQSRGLPAGHDLSGVIDDIYLILTLPPSAAQKAEQRAFPPNPRLEPVLRDLDAKAKDYVQIEKSQPQQRSC